MTSCLSSQARFTKMCKLDIAKDYTFPIKRNETKRNVSVVCKIQILRQKLHIHNKSGDASIALCAPLCQGQGGDPFLLLTLYSLHLYLHLYFYLHLYSYCICNCIALYLLGVPRSERRFLFCFSLYIHTTCDCCCFFRPACYMRMQNRIQPDVVTMRCARYVKAWF